MPAAIAELRCSVRGTEALSATASARGRCATRWLGRRADVIALTVAGTDEQAWREALSQRGHVRGRAVAW